MAPFDWRPTGTIDPERRAEARRQLLSAAQWLARVERSYAGGGRGDSIGLCWSDERAAIATHRFASDFGLELRIDDLVMQFTEDGAQTSHEIDVEERSPAHVEAWILVELLHRGVDRDRFSKDLPYDVTELMSGDGVEFSPEQYRDELRDLGAWFRNAVTAIRRASKANGSTTLAIAPQSLRLEALSDGRRLGFSPGDADIPEPYFYVASGDGPTAILRISEIPDDTPAERVSNFLAGDLAPTRH